MPIIGLFIDFAIGSPPLASSSASMLPGDDAPERVVFEGLKARNWEGIHQRVGRPFANVTDVCSRAMAASDHHEWVSDAASKLILGGDTLWQAMCAEWARTCLPVNDAKKIKQPIEDALIGLGPEAPAPQTTPAPPVESAPVPTRVLEAVSRSPKRGDSPSGQPRLFEQ